VGADVAEAFLCEISATGATGRPAQRTGPANITGSLNGLWSALIESQRPNIARTVHHAHDDDFIVGEAVIQHVVAVEMRPQSRGQTLAARADLRMRLDRRETRLDLADQL
jgi:hypothetical protein